jgi:hypothetical protein
MRSLLFLVKLQILCFSPSTAFAQYFSWAQGLTGANPVYIYRNEVDKNNNNYIVGAFNGTVDFDASSSVSNLTAIGSYNMFLLKEDSAGSFLWVKHFPGLSSSAIATFGRGLVIDSLKNIYIAGEYRDSFDFDPGPTVYKVNRTAGGNAFILKLDSSGNFLWVRDMGGQVLADGMQLLAMQMDKQKNFYFACSMSGTSDVDPGPNTVNITSAASPGNDVVLEKLDSTGNFIWAKQITGPLDKDVFSLVLDDSANIYVGGEFKGTEDFDPGPSVANLTSLGDYDGFVAKYDSAGNHIWSKSIGSTGTDFVWGVTVDCFQNVLVTGDFQGTADFDPGPAVNSMTSAGSYDAFILRLRNMGTFSWARKMGSSGADAGIRATTDAGGNIYSTGQFSSVVDFDPGVGIYNLTSQGNRDNYVQKLDSSGSFLWAVGFGITGDDQPNWIILDNSSNVVTSGFMGYGGVNSGIGDFDPGPGVFMLTGSFNSYIEKLAQCLTPTATISGNTSPCSGNSTTYTLTTNVAGSTIQWKKNGINVGTNSSTYTYTPANGDQVQAVVTVPASVCTTNPTASSNTLTITPGSPIVPSMAISGNNNVCSGATTTFTASSNITGGTVQWKVNNANAGSGGTAFSYVPTNNDLVKAVLTTPTTGCYTTGTATSNTITMTVNPTIAPTLTITTTSNPVCAGTPVTFNSAANISGGMIIWNVNGITVAINVNSYTYTPVNNDVVTAIDTLPATACTTTPVVSSNAVTMTVNPMITPNAVITGPVSASLGQSVTVNATVTNAGSSYSLTWKNHGNTIGTTSVPSLTYTKGLGTDTITVQVTPLTSGCWDASMTNAHIFTLITGIAETLKAAGIEVYPNPFADIIYIKGLKPNDNVKLLDMSGRVILTWQASKEVETFKADGLAAGHYLLKIMTRSGTVRVNVPIVKN